MSALRSLALLFVALLAAPAEAQIAYTNHNQASVATGDTISFVNAGAQVASNTSGATITPAIPGGTAAGDFAVLIVAGRPTDATNPGTPAGWTPRSSRLREVGANDLKILTYYRVLAGGDANPGVVVPATWSGGGGGMSAQIAVWRGVDPATPFDAADVTNDSAAVRNWVPPAITTVTPAAWVVTAVATSDNNALDFAGGLSQGFSARMSGGGYDTTVGGDHAIALADFAQAAPAAATMPTWRQTANNDDLWVGITFALRPLGSALTITVPGGTGVGDVMIASITYRPCSGASGAACTTTITAHADWTPVNTVTDQTTGAGTGGFGNRLFVYRRVVDGTEPASYTWTFGGAIVHAGAAGGIIRFSGVDTASPIVAEGGQTTASATSHTAPSINTGAVTNTMLVSSHSANSSTLWDPPGGMTERVDAASLAVPDALGLAIEVNHETFAGSGATGTRTASFTAPAPAADTGLTHMLALRPAVAFSHYAITGPSGTTFATCEPAVVRITAHNAAHVAVNPPAGTTLALRTSTNSGVWLAFSAGAGDLGTAANFVTLGLNDGQASYTWSGSESVLQVRLRHNTATALSVNLNPAGSPQEDAGEDPTFTFADSVMRVTADGSTSATVGTQIAGKPSDTGAGAQTLYVQAVATAPATGACTTLFRNQTVNVEFAAVCENPTACSAVAETDMWVQNNASAYVSVAKNNGPGAPASYTAVPLAFSNDANAMAPLVLRYGDAGQVRLYLRSALPSPPAGTYVSGSSNSFVVRPFGFAFPAVQHGVDQTSAVLAAAGDNFAMNVAAYKWSAADDDGTGNPRTDITINLTDNGIVIPANSVTPSFAALTTVAVLAGSNTPGVADGTITRQSTGLGDIAAGEFSGGSSAVADWRYSEVGNVTFRATSSNYLGSGASITGRSTMDGTGNRVGRFKPKHFALLGAPAPTLTNRAAIGACAASTFTYMNEGLSLAFSLEAQNAQNAKTSNYTGAYAKLSTASLAPFNLGARSGGTDLTSRIDTGVAPSGSWSNGTLALTATTGIKRNNAGPNPQDNPDGPFTGILWGIAPNDNDPDPGSGVQMNTLDLDVDGVGGNDHKNLGVSTEVRFGRLRCQNALGSDKTALPMPMTAEYWNGTAFTTNLLDSCTPIAPADIGKGNFRGNLTAPELGAPTVTAISSGAGRITLPKPSGGDGNYVGALDVTFNVSGAGLPFLLGNWSAADPDSSAATAYDDNPVCGASFGLYGSQPKQFIFFRENY